VRGLAAGEKGYEKYKKLFEEKFVFLNEYTTSVQAEHDPRGPEGPYRFQDRSVPVLVFKRWDGETLIQQLGFYPDPTQAKRSLAQYVDRALKKNGPVVPPKHLRPLLKAFEKGEKHLEKGLVSAAIREFSKVVRYGANEKKFPSKPDVARKAEEKLAELGKAAETGIAEAKALEDPREVRKALRKIGRDYGKLAGVKEKVKEALDTLPE